MDIFSNEEQEQLAQAIGLAEAGTSGEIRVCVEHRCEGDAMSRATACFHTLGMHKTALRNGVFICLSVDDHQFAIIGDAGIHRKVPADFWEITKEKMLSYFKQGKLKDGLIAGIASAGEQLKGLFPSAPDDVNELPNEVVFLKRPE